ncbi:hypothetical protein Ahu01nite_064740 [Winogradskya humida]|uniref:Uncharacterized protein n=1 Tax=Winogradskya humida TaxID=113566 RepID=A0ABQ3ZXP4_9ACTN|nr:hypothetical protein Ahu01nite_064740 [Actinoplanes humidus]
MGSVGQHQPDDAPAPDRAMKTDDRTPRSPAAAPARTTDFAALGLPAMPPAADPGARVPVVPARPVPARSDLSSTDHGAEGADSGGFDSEVPAASATDSEDAVPQSPGQLEGSAARLPRRVMAGSPRRPARGGPRELQPHRMALALALVSAGPPLIIINGLKGVPVAVAGVLYAAWLLIGKKLPRRRR